MHNLHTYLFNKHVEKNTLHTHTNTRILVDILMHTDAHG